MAATGLNHVSISADDMGESLRFYEELFGMERVPSPEYGFHVEWLRVGDLQLHLFARDADAPKYHHVGLTVDDFTAVYVKARELGALEHMPPFAQIYELPDGGIQMYLRDPAGNLIEVDHPDASTVDRTVVTGVRRIADAVPQDEWNLQATLFLPREAPVAP